MSARDVVGEMRTVRDDGAKAMAEFLVVMVACGAIAGLWLNWVFLSLVGLFVMPIYAGVMVWAGNGPGLSIAGAMLGFLVLQVGFVASGWGAELWRSRFAPSRRFKKGEKSREI